MASANSPQLNPPDLNTPLPSPTPEPGSIDLAVLTLDDEGVIQHCSETCEQVFGYQQDELAGRHVSALIPKLDAAELVEGDRINARLAFFCHCAIPFQARHRDGRCFPSELFINRLGSHNVRVLVRRFDGSLHTQGVRPLG